MQTNPGTRSDPQTLADWFRRRAEKAACQTALTFEGDTWSYARMQNNIDRLAAVLQKQGVQHGDRVSYLGFNRPECLFTLFACATLGAIFVPLNFRLSAPELAFLAQDAEISVLLVGEEHAALAEAFVHELAGCRIIAVGVGAGPRWPTLGALLAQEAATARAVPASPVRRDDVAAIFYTSGTTGRPKGAMLTHANLWANNLNWILAFSIGGHDTVLTGAPMFHVSGLFVLLTAVLMVGGHVVLHRSFDAEETLRAFETHRVTLTFSVPTMMLFMSQAECFNRVDLSHLRLLVAGGAPTPESLLRRYAERGIPVSHCYGISECTSASTYLETGLAMSKLNSAGHPMALADIKLTDLDGSDIEQAHVKGEICIRGDNVTPGYWRNPQATAAVLPSDG